MVPQSPRSPGFNVRAKGWFLTYPRCSASKEEVLAALKKKGKVIKQIVVSRELHEDGHPHVHVYLYLEDRFNCKSAAFWDILGYHGNYQAAKSLKAVQNYIKKDGDFVQEGIDYVQEVKAISNHRAILGKRFLDGEDPLEVIQENPELFFMAASIKVNLAAIDSWRKPTLSRCTGFIPNTWGQILTIQPSCVKQRHYWFWSSGPNMGKTNFLKAIAKDYPSFWYSCAEPFQTSSPHAQFVLIDEYSRGILTVTQLNQMCDGTYQYPVKGSSSFSLPDSIIMVCGNKSPLEIYSEEHHELIKARFIINCIG